MEQSLQPYQLLRLTLKLAFRTLVGYSGVERANEKARHGTSMTSDAVRSLKLRASQHGTLLTTGRPPR